MYASKLSSRLPLAFSVVSGKMAHEKWQAATNFILGHPWISRPQVGIHGVIAYLRTVLVPLPNCAQPWRTDAQTSGGEIRGRRSWGPFS